MGPAGKDKNDRRSAFRSWLCAGRGGESLGRACLDGSGSWRRPPARGDRLPEPLPPVRPGPFQGLRDSRSVRNSQRLPFGGERNKQEQPGCGWDHPDRSPCSVKSVPSRPHVSPEHPLVGDRLTAVLFPGEVRVPHQFRAVESSSLRFVWRQVQIRTSEKTRPGSVAGWQRHLVVSRDLRESCASLKEAHGFLARSVGWTLFPRVRFLCGEERDICMPRSCSVPWKTPAMAGEILCVGLHFSWS